MLRRSDFIAATYALSLVLANFGIAIAARMPMITTTISSSMRVKPFLLRIMWTSPAAVGMGSGQRRPCTIKTWVFTRKQRVYAWLACSTLQPDYTFFTKKVPVRRETSRALEDGARKRGFCLRRAATRVQRSRPRDCRKAGPDTGQLDSRLTRVEGVVGRTTVRAAEPRAIAPHHPIRRCRVVRAR